MDFYTLAAIAFIFIFTMFNALREIRFLRGKLAMSQNMLTELAPKAKAWDLYLACRRKPRASGWMSKPSIQEAARACLDADTEANFLVAYQHLSAECSDGE